MGKREGEVKKRAQWTLADSEVLGIKGDVGGQKTLRSYWRNYFEKTDALIWVVDATDRLRIDDCREELHGLLQEEVRSISLMYFNHSVHEQKLTGGRGPATVGRQSPRVRQQDGRPGVHGRGRDTTGAPAQGGAHARVAHLALQRDDGHESPGGAGLGGRGREGEAVPVLRRL